MGRFFMIPFPQKMAIIKMIFILSYSSILVKLVPLKYYYRYYILRPSVETPCGLQPIKGQIRLYTKVMNIFPWRITCLMQSMAFHIYFKRMGFHVPIYIGLKIEEHLLAHAWNFERFEKEFCVIN